MLKIGIIVGSNRTERIGLTISLWVEQLLQSDDYTTEIIDLAAQDLPWLDEPEIPAAGNYQKPITQAWSQLIQGFDGFVIVFPQYNWGYPAVLKNALDTLYSEWRGKPVSIISYGSHGGFQGMQALRWVLTGLKMNQLVTQIGLVTGDEMFDEHGHFKNIDQALAGQAGQVTLLRQNLEQVFEHKK